MNSSRPDSRSLLFSVAVLTSATGNGVFFAFSIVMLQASTGLPLAVVGVAVSVSALVVLPLVPSAGRLMDRHGVGRVLLAAGAVRAACFFAFSFHLNVVVLALLLAAASVASKAEQAGAPAIAGKLGGASLPKWIARLRILHNIGMGAGTLVAGVWLSASPASLGDLPWVCATLFLIGGIAYWSLGDDRLPAKAPGETRRSSWRSVSFLIAATMNALLLLVAGAAESAVAIDFLEIMDLPAWYVSFFFIANTVILILIQLPLAKWIEKRATSTNILIGSLLYASSFVALLTTRLSELPIVVVAAAVLFLTVGEAILIQSMLVLLMDLAPEGQRAEYMATDQVLSGVALGLAPLLASVVLPWAPVTFWTFLAALTLTVGLLASLVLKSHVNVEAAPIQMKDEAVD